MKKVDFNKLQAGDLVEVPRTQFAPMRSGWNGWLFSEAVVIRKGVGRKSKKNVVVVEMRTPAGKNSYGTIEATFYAENVFTTPAAKNARNILKKYGICRWDVLGNAGLQSEETIALLAIENSKPHKDGLLFRICQYVEFKQRARRENEKL